MSYLVLARKYRPQTFSEVVGQEHVTRTLANAFEQDRVHHAFLFCGPRGVGKTTAARILGKALNCEQGPTPTPCGACGACTSISSGTAVDYHEMDGASNRGIDAIRELTEAVRYQPAILRKKVYVIDEVHMLTTEAFNALLKTLEEPPPHVTFVLATTEPHKVPNTILSRCQRYDFKLVPQQRLVEYLGDIFGRESLDVDPGAVALIGRESGGSVRDAMSLSDQIISYAGDESISERKVAEVLGVADRTLTRALVGTLASGDAGAALEAVDSAVARGVDEVQLARAIVRHLRDLAVVQVAPQSRALVEGSDEDRADLAEQAGRIDRSRVLQMFDRMVRAAQDLAQSQMPRLVLDLALIDVAALEPVVPLGDLIDRLGALEARLGGGGGGGGGPGPRRPGPPPGREPRARGRAAPARSSPAGPATASRAEPEPQPAPAAAPATPEPAATAPATPEPVPAAPATAPATPEPAATAPATPEPAATAPATPEPVPAAPEPALPAPAAGEFGFSQAAIAAADRRASAPDRPPHPADTGPPHPADAGPPHLAEGSGPASTDRDGPPDNGAAVAATAPVAVPRSPEQMLREWEAIMAALERARKMSFIAVYEHARIVSWAADEIVVGFPSDDLTAERASDRDVVADMSEFLSEHYGRPVRLVVRTLRDGEATVTDQARSLIEVERQRAAAERDEREAEAREHPATKMVLETFGASIKEIKTDV